MTEKDRFMGLKPENPADPEGGSGRKGMELFGKKESQPEDLEAWIAAAKERIGELSFEESGRVIEILVKARPPKPKEEEPNVGPNIDEE
ncbi:MAG: hypothetical protein NTW60_01585 [Candidatus Wolfebacteria bacterium]|nr:hypothetical protein [Candidatus Wolfebacteria bacterium]